MKLTVPTLEPHELDRLYEIGFGTPYNMNGFSKKEAAIFGYVEGYRQALEDLSAEIRREVTGIEE